MPVYYSASTSVAGAFKALSPSFLFIQEIILFLRSNNRDPTPNIKHIPNLHKEFRDFACSGHTDSDFHLHGFDANLYLCK